MASTTPSHQPIKIRPATLPRDHAALNTIFTTTAGPAFKTSEPARTIASWTFCHQYPYLTPQTCFVLEASGEAVGYVLGAPDTQRFVTQGQDNLDSILDEMRKSQPSISRPPDDGREGPRFEDDVGAWLLHLVCNKPEEIYNGTVPGLWEAYPAHFHIDILPAYQRQGWGRKLIERMCEALKEAGSKGVHLGMEAANEDAEKFYQKVGFERYGRVLDGGESREVGRTGGANDVVFMVKAL